MKEYILSNNRLKEIKNNVAIYDEITVRQGLFPLGLFSNPRKDLGGKDFFCFVGCYEPDGLRSSDEKEFFAAMTYLNGDFMKDAMALLQEKQKAGWGQGDTPTEAFRQAMKVAGYFKQKV